MVLKKPSVCIDRRQPGSCGTPLVRTPAAWRSRLALLFWLSVLGVTTVVVGQEIEIRGRVVDAEGRGLAQAGIELVPLPDAAGAARLELAGHFPPAPVVATQSGVGGGFRLLAPQPGLWGVRVRHPQHPPLHRLLGGVLEPVTIGTLALHRRAMQPLRVVDASQRGVAGLRLTVCELDDTGWPCESRVVETDAEGRALVPRAVGAPVVLAGIASEFYLHETLPPGAGSVELVLRDRLVPARLVDTADRSMSEVAVFLRQPLLALDRSDAGGRVRIPETWPTDPPLLFVAGGTAYLATGVPGSSAEAESVLELSATPTIHGRVIDAETGEAVAGALVWSTAGCQTDPQGAFALALGVDRPAVVTAAAAGYRPTRVRVRELAAPDGMTIGLEPSPAYYGRVVDADGRGLAGAEVQAVPVVEETTSPMSVVRAEADAEGYFRLAELGARRAHRLRVSLSGYAERTVTAPPLDAGRPATRLDIVLQRRLDAYGTVLDVDERPVAHATVTLVSARTGLDRSLPHPEVNHRTTTDGEGWFEIAGLAPGIFTLAVRAPEYAPLEIPGLEVLGAEGPIDLGTVLLAPGAVLDGRVVDLDSTPIAGAKVRWSSHGAGGDSLNSGETTADAAGLFRIPGLASTARLELTATHPGYQAGKFAAVPVERTAPLELVLEPGAELRGLVIDVAQRAVLGARVHLSFASGGKASTVLTGEDGDFLFGEEPPGTYIVTVDSAAGYAEPLAVDIEAGRERSVKIVLEPAATLTGWLTDPDGHAVADARIAVERRQPGAVPERDIAFGRGMGTSATDAGGRFTVHGLAEGSYRLSARHPEFEPLDEVLELSAGTARQVSLVFRTRRQRPIIRGRIVDPSGLGVGDATVRLLVDGGGAVAETTSFADGRFELAAPAVGVYAVSAEHASFAEGRSPALQVDSAGLDNLLIELRGGAAVIGEIHGLPLEEFAQLRVLAFGHGRRTRVGAVDYSGHYRITGLAPGRWTIDAAGPGRRTTAEVEVIGEGDEVWLDLEFANGLRLRGIVLADGRRLAGAWVTVACDADGYTRALPTQPDGTFALDDLPVATCDLEARNRDGRTARRTVDMTGDREIVLAIEGVALTGSVLSADDHQPIGGAIVELLSPSAGWKRLQSTETDALGRFTFPAVEGGRWVLRAIADDFAVVHREIETAGTRPAGEERILLPPTVPTVLNVLTANGQVPRRVTVLFGDPPNPPQRIYRPDAAGRVVLHSLPPGRSRLGLFDTAGNTAQVEVEVPGEPVTVILEPPGL